MHRVLIVQFYKSPINQVITARNKGRFITAEI